MHANFHEDWPQKKRTLFFYAIGQCFCCRLYLRIYISFRKNLYPSLAPATFPGAPSTTMGFSFSSRLITPGTLCSQEEWTPRKSQSKSNQNILLFFITKTCQITLRWFFDNTVAIQAIQPLTLLSLGLPFILLVCGLLFAMMGLIYELA